MSHRASVIERRRQGGRGRWIELLRRVERKAETEFRRGGAGRERENEGGGVEMEGAREQEKRRGKITKYPFSVKMPICKM